MNHTRFLVLRLIAIGLLLALPSLLSAKPLDVNLVSAECHPAQLRIEKELDVVQGTEAILDVVLEQCTLEFSGYDLFFAWNAAALCFSYAEECGPLESDCGWEYFTYRYGPDGDYDSTSPGGLVRVIGIAETNNGPHHPSCYLPDSLPAVLTRLHFLVSDDRTLAGQFLPVRFYWMDCGDNVFASAPDGDSLYMSRYVYDYDGSLMTAEDTLPTFHGAPTVCIADSVDYTRVRRVDFYNGGVGLLPFDTTVLRGDCNGNGAEWEVADAVCLAKYFTELEDQCADSCDPNGDGYYQHIADLSYIVHVIAGDLSPDELVDTVADFTVQFVQDTVAWTITVTAPEVPDGIPMYLEMLGQIEIAPHDQSIGCRSRFDGEHTRIGLYATGSYRTWTGGELVLDYAGYGILDEAQAGITEGIMAPTEIHFGVSTHEYQVRIGYLDDVIQGQFYDLPVTLETIDPVLGLGCFDLLVGYDNSALAFQQVIKGDIYTECGWEYFTYRFGPDGHCDSTCPSGQTRVIGIAETNNGPYHPGCQSPTPYVGTLPVSLFHLRFLVSNSRELEGQFVPVRFFWMDCGDNTLANHIGFELYISDEVYDYGNPDPIQCDTVGFPTFLGAQEDCLDVEPGRPSVIRHIDFYNGGLQIVVADTIDDGTCGPGDISGNGVAYEIVDYVLYRHYFVEGWSAFSSLDSQCVVSASDVNQDGQPLTLADLVWLYAVIVGDGLTPVPDTGMSPNTAHFVDDPGNHQVQVFTVDTLRAVLLVFEGEVTPSTGASGCGITYNIENGQTRVLLSPNRGECDMISGRVLQYTGSGCRLIEAYAADKHARTVNTTINEYVDVEENEHGNLPDDYSLSQNYPNPFNPMTTIEYALPCGGPVEIAIYNITGQLVKRLVDDDKAPGWYTVDWYSDNQSGQQVSSGIYLYRMKAGDYMQTRKMILLK